MPVLLKSFLITVITGSPSIELVISTVLRAMWYIESILYDFVWGQISSSQNRFKLVQTAQIKFPYLSCCSLVSFLYILGPLEAIWTGFSFQSFPHQEIGKGGSLHFEPLAPKSSKNSIPTTEAPQNPASTSLESYSNC